MSEAELVQRFAAAVAQQLRPASIPIQYDLWDIATIAQYLKREPSVVRERVACLPDFPKAIRLPAAKGRGHPLYRASEVIAWVDSYKERSRD